MAKTPNPIDVHVGSRVRLRRMMKGLSQERLGDALNLTFQQVQKYEKGINRIGASRLYAIAQILEAPIQFFFEEMPDVEEDHLPGNNFHKKGALSLDSFIASAEGLEINIAFSKIEDQKMRRHLADLVCSVADGARVNTS